MNKNRKIEVFFKRKLKKKIKIIEKDLENWEKKESIRKLKIN